MAYIVVRTIKGRQYRYLQHSFREGKKVRTVSEYLGPVGAILRVPRRLGRAIGELIEANRTIGPIIDEEAMLRDLNAKEAAHARMIERFQRETGLKMPVRNPMPIDKPVPINPTIQGPTPVDAHAGGVSSSQRTDSSDMGESINSAS